MYAHFPKIIYTKSQISFKYHNKKICPYNEHPLEPYFHIVKLGYAGVICYVWPKTYIVLTMYVLSTNIKTITTPLYCCNGSKVTCHVTAVAVASVVLILELFVILFIFFFNDIKVPFL